MIPSGCSRLHLGMLKVMQNGEFVNFGKWLGIHRNYKFIQPFQKVMLKLINKTSQLHHNP